MVLYLILIFGLSGLFFQRSKFLTLLIYLFIWTLMWNTRTADYGAYENIYILNEFRDGGYSVLCALGRMLGLTFFQFYLTITGLALIVYCRFTLKYARCCSLVAALYLLFICFFDIVQFRNFVAFSIVLLALPQLFVNGRYNIIIFCTAVALAATIHVTMLFYLVYPFMNRDVFKLANLKRYIIPLILLVIAMYFGVSMFEDRLNTISNNYNKGVSIYSAIFIVLLVFGNIGYLWYWTTRRATEPLSLEQEDLSENPKDLVLFFNIAMVLLMPIAFKSMTIFRLFKYMAIVNFAFVSNKFTNPKSFKIIPQTIVITLYGLVYLVLFIYIHITQFIPRVMLPILNRNLFWEFLN